MSGRQSQWKIRRGRDASAVSIGLFVLSLCLAALLYGWFARSSSERDSNEYQFVKPDSKPPSIRTWHRVDGFPAAISQIESVFWEPDDTVTLRNWLLETKRLSDANVLEIGCGTGLVAITCALHGAKQVVATDINPAAVLNTSYNAELCGVTSRIDARQVDEGAPGPFAVIAADETFDLIVSNPPWEDAPVTTAASYAFYDPDFQLLDGILASGQEHLTPEGSLLLAYGCKTAIKRVLEKAPQHNWQVEIHDARILDDLPEVFLPGMLIEMRPK